MFISRKKISVLIVVFVVSLVSIFSVLNFKTNVSKLSNNVTVVLDAGHGGIDGGVVGLSGIKESDINLDIVYRIKEKLENMNFNVVLTREGKDAFSQKKREDMKKRKDIIIKANPDALISIHVNKCPYSKRRGVQVFYDDLNVGKSFATLMQSSLNSYVNEKYAKRSDLSALPGDYFITKCVMVPSIIIECGFISNKEDEDLLLKDDYKDELAKVISNTLFNAFCAESYS